MSTKEQRDAAQAANDGMRADIAADRARVAQLCVELGHGFVVSEAAQAWATYVPPPAERGSAPMRYSGVATWLSSLLRGFKRAADLEKAVGGEVKDVATTAAAGAFDVRELSPACVEVLRGLVHGPRLGGTDEYADAYAWLRDHDLITWDHFKATREGHAALASYDSAKSGES
jgi:hypothetical protein